MPTDGYDKDIGAFCNHTNMPKNCARYWEGKSPQENLLPVSHPFPPAIVSSHCFLFDLHYFSTHSVHFFTLKMEASGSLKTLVLNELNGVTAQKTIFSITYLDDKP